MKKSISSLAEDIIKQNLTSFIKESVNTQINESPDPDTPDISDVKVPNDFVTAILEDRKVYKVEESRPPIEQSKEELNEEVEEEESLEDFILEFKSLLTRGTLLLQELCSSGMIGVGPGKPKKKKKYVLKRKNKKPVTGTPNRKG